MKARDHYILNYKIADSGTAGDIMVDVDETEKEYTYEIMVPVTSSTQLEVLRRMLGVALRYWKVRSLQSKRE